MKWIPIVLAFFTLSACSGGERTDPPALSAELQAELESWLAEYGKPPADFVLGLFDKHDVVVLGEQHTIRHDPLFVQELLGRLHEAEVDVFAMEFARRSDQTLIDSLMAAPEWDEDLAREIQFRMFMPWGYREYLDILKAAWRVNGDGHPLRLIGVNNTLDYSHFESEADWNDDEIWKRVLGNQTEADWAEAVLAQVRAGEKVLVYSGINHAFTGFRQPRVEKGEYAGESRQRMGYVLREALGARAITVYLHAPWNGAGGYSDTMVHPAGGRLDAFMLNREDGPFAVGFETAASPLAHLPVEDAVYMHGRAGFCMADFADGWIYRKPVGEFEPVTYIEDWIHGGNVDEARSVAMNPIWRDFDVRQFNRGCQSYLEDFERYYGHLR